jgi:hypothetical protein
MHTRHDVKGVSTHVDQASAPALGTDEGNGTPVPAVSVMTLVSLLALAGGALIAWM